MTFKTQQANEKKSDLVRGSPGLAHADLASGNGFGPEPWDPAPSGIAAALAVLVFFAALLLSGILLIA